MMSQVSIGTMKSNSSILRKSRSNSIFNKGQSMSRMHTYRKGRCSGHDHTGNSIRRKTFNTKIRAATKDSKIPEYQYFKEKKLLEFLTLKGKKNDKV